MHNVSHAGNDRPVKEGQDDRYGFEPLAAGLAGRILALNKNISTVIGIEGRWGAGKTSLLNLLMEHLSERKSEKTKILPISPWLSPPGSPLMESLLLSVAALLDEEESRSYTFKQKMWHKVRKAPASPLAKLLINYTQKTSGGLATLAALGGNFMPGLNVVSQGMNAISKLDLSTHKETTELLRRRIEKGITDSGLDFIVIIDDLDRLEPSQAVEVLRLVRSVADFAGFRYIMCYDPGVLSHAVERELGVSDGRMYLQKIIPLSFTLPHPEAFDLPRELLRGVVDLYERVNNDVPTEAEYAHLRKAAWIYGQELSTPREVNLVLNALEFRYADIRDYVYFPDLCLLQLVKVTNPGLYDWTEQYLTKYFVRVSGEIDYTDPEQDRMKSELTQQLGHYISPEPASVEELGRWVPGIVELAGDIHLFKTGAEQTNESSMKHKRLGSSTYWRYYFAFSAPQNALPANLLDDMLRRFGLAAERETLAAEMLGYIREISLTHVTWYDHILSQLTARKIATLNFAQCEGLLWYFFNFSDMAGSIQMYLGRGQYGTTSTLKEVCDLLVRILLLNRLRGLWLFRKLLLQGNARGYLVQFMRDLLWGHGLLGHRPWETDEQFLSDDELTSLQEALAVRMGTSEMQDTLFNQLDLAGYLYAWREIHSVAEASLWASRVIDSDDAFIHLLNGVKGHAWNSVTGEYRSLGIEKVEHLVGRADEVVTRLQLLSAEPRLNEEAKELLETLKRSNRDLKI
jgi:hypothetical protein